MRHYDLEDVFVTGGEPTVTYVARPERGLEDEVQQYLRVGRKVLAVSGPSKSGKSTLINRVLRDTTATPYIRLTGASLTSMEAFWEIVAYRASLPSAVTTTTEETDGFEGQVATKVGGGFIPGEIAARFGAKVDSRTSTARTSTTALGESVKDALLSLKICLVIDDFHYAPAGVRVTIARELKELAFSGARVILIAIPERVMDVLQEEGELNGRLEKLRVREWDDIELLRIATQGFEALNVYDAESGALASQLVAQSYGSPLLMQELCEKVCRYNEITETSLELTPVEAPYWDDFFSEVAANIQPGVVEHLKRGPVSRRPREERSMTGGGAVDLYSAVLLVLHRKRGKRQMTPAELSTAMNEFMDVRPQLQLVRRTCENMSKIALAQRGDGDAALDYSSNPERLTVVDPYLAFYIAWGLQGLGIPIPGRA